MLRLLSNVLFALSVIFVLIGTNNASAACDVSATPINFGSYDMFLQTPHDATGSITVTCDESPPPTVDIAVGQSANSGGFDPRAMKLSTGSDLLEYNVYTNKQHTRVWGDGSGGTYTKNEKVHKNRPWTSTIYARIAAEQDVPSGLYNDSLTVTITW